MLSHLFFFFFNDTATTEIYTRFYTLSLHDALPICLPEAAPAWKRLGGWRLLGPAGHPARAQMWVEEQIGRAHV